MSAPRALAPRLCRARLCLLACFPPGTSFGLATALPTGGIPLPLLAPIGLWLLTIVVAAPLAARPSIGPTGATTRVRRAAVDVVGRRGPTRRHGTNAPASLVIVLRARPTLP